MGILKQLTGIVLAGITCCASAASLPNDIKSLLKQHLYTTAFPKLQKLAFINRNDEAAYMLANYYSCGKVVAFNCQQAVNLYKQVVADTQSITLKENANGELAWLYATCQQEGFAPQPFKAFELALPLAMQDSAGYKLDTLAATYAAMGQYGQAVQVQQQAISKLEEQKQTSYVPEYTILAFKQRAKQYAEQTPMVVNAQNAAANCNALPE